MSSFYNSEFPLPYASIAAFYTNIDTTNGGAVYYRETNETHVLTKAEESVQNNFIEYYDFKPTSVFIATWLEVTYDGASNNQKNSFQIAIISNGNESFVELLYPERDIQWIQRNVLSSGLPEAKAQAGFVAEDGRVFLLRGSGSHQIRNIASWSNVHEPGKYVFRVGNISLEENIAVPDQYNLNEIEYEEESKSCAQSGLSICHIEARCVDYESGICCQCNDGFYGNGKSCIKDDVPLRVHGKLNGIINGISFNEVDIQSYVVVAEGRSYTALSSFPPALGSSLQFLNVLGGVVGWLFAKPLQGAKNGYQLTGSLFNHSAELYFPATGERVTINQEYLGHDVFDQISLETDVRGTLPVLIEGINLETLDLEEQYTLVNPGILRSDSSRSFTNKITGNKYDVRISQTFTFNTCRFAPTEIAQPLTLRVNKNYLSHESKDNIVRYGSHNTISLLNQEDPCIRGRSTCGPHSSCVVQGDSYTCVCQSGFTKIYQDDTLICIDIDECRAGTHNCDTNADCYNHAGGFQCRCRAGFEGNGVNCKVLLRCREKNCDNNAHCVENFGEDPVCVCNSGYIGDGTSCTESYEIACSKCSPYASCHFSEIANTYSCICNSGYYGNGQYCEVNVPVETTTVVAEVNTEADYNDTVVLPICDEYGCACPTGYSNYRDERNNELCRINAYEEPPNSYTTFEVTNDTIIPCESEQDCPPNAICSFLATDGTDDRYGHCVCPEGYEGGYECVRKSQRPSCSCGSNAHCVETEDNEVCVCDAGYHGNGYDCRYILSCSSNSDCEQNAECRSDSGSEEFTCQCIDGYAKDENEACIPDGPYCNGAICAEHASCLYDAARDVRNCHCDEGFQGEGTVSCSPHGDICDANSCSPDATCTPYDNSYECACREGFIGDGYTCILDQNCRTDPSMCSLYASCLKRSDSYICECNSDFRGNGSYCEPNPKLPGNFLIASDGASIYRVPFVVTPRNFATPFNSAIYQIAVGVDIDCESGKVYWGDVVGNTIKRSSYDGSQFDQFLVNGVKSPEGIAVDWSARNVFWTDSKKATIEVANIDTKARKVLFAIDEIKNPRGIAVHPSRGKIFWSDWNRIGPKIEWANMDGTQRGVFLDKTDVSLPNSLAIDWARERLCYADAGTFSIKCVEIDTKERQTIATNCTYPFGLAINGDTFYWTDWKTLKIEYIDISTNRRGEVPIATASRRLYGLAVAPESCPPARNVCSQRNGNCNPGQLCLPNGRNGRTCVDGDTTFQENLI